MVLYDYDRNVILSEPMKSRRDAEMERAFKKIVKTLITRGFKQKY